MSLEPQRRRFQFSLRWMLGALTVFAVLFAIGGYILQNWNGGEEGRRRRRMQELVWSNDGNWSHTRKFGGGDLLMLPVASKIQIDAVLKELSRFDNQIEMDFRLSQFGDKQLRQLVGHRRLASLVASSTLVTDDGLKEIIEFQELTVLELDETAVTDAGLEHVSKLSKLEYLTLDDTAITDAGLECLAKLPNLKSLHVTDTKVTDEGIAKLKRTLPNLEVNVYYGLNLTGK